MSQLHFFADGGRSIYAPAGPPHSSWSRDQWQYGIPVFRVSAGVRRPGTKRRSEPRTRGGRRQRQERWRPASGRPLRSCPGCSSCLDAITELQLNNGVQNLASWVVFGEKLVLQEGVDKSSGGCSSSPACHHPGHKVKSKAWQCMSQDLSGWLGWSLGRWWLALLAPALPLPISTLSHR